MSLKVTKDRVPDLLRAVRDLTKSEVLVGIPDAEAGREDGPISNAEIGYLMETGSPSQNIPERPFLVPGVESARERIEKRMRSAGEAALAGRRDDVSTAFEKAGIEASSAVKAKISDGPFTPLSPKTLAKRRARGRAGEKPLIDTGQLRRAITYVVRKKGDD
ncbi:hypothetical protein AB4099_18990 [Bosea sp. 2KB_26]|uniref:hypothetical protein n=1 Tax=Bosea sp. 2KB_26 TaxID=3237475 RepID=UPI003F8F2C24